VPLRAVDDIHIECLIRRGQHIERDLAPGGHVTSTSQSLPPASVRKCWSIYGCPGSAVNPLPSRQNPRASARGFCTDTMDIEEAGCFLNLPFPDDPGARLWPDLNFFDVAGELNVRMGSGSSNADGRFTTNVDGTQFGTLEGPVTVQ
jgi:hypothetical protein